jgi:nicotinamide mononucleotide transporter
MSWTEIIAAILGVVNVWLVVRRSVWNYPFGIAMVSLYAFVFFQARLYSDAILQGYYFVIQIYGWWYWLQGRASDGRIQPELMSSAGRLAASAVTLIGAAAGGWFFSNYTNAAAPWLDAFIASASVTAQYLMSIRKIENWVWWIVVDVVAIGVYFWKELYPTTALYAIFLALSIWGLIGWQRELRVEQINLVTGEYSG